MGKNLDSALMLFKSILRAEKSLEKKRKMLDYFVSLLNEEEINRYYKITRQMETGEIE